MRWMNTWMGRGAVLVVAVCWLLIATTAAAQSKKSAKQAASLEKAGESSKAAVQDVLDNLDEVLIGYNSIIDGTAKNPQSTYKKLVGALKGTGKKIDGARKQLATLNKEADKFFKAWEQDLSSISSENLREKSTNRMDAAKKKYASMGETLTLAAGEFAPVIQNLNDQILFLGRDLSPGAVAELQDEAKTLNQQAETVKAKVKEMLQAAGKTQAEPEVEANAEPEPEPEPEPEVETDVEREGENSEN